MDMCTLYWYCKLSMRLPAKQTNKPHPSSCAHFQSCFTLELELELTAHTRYSSALTIIHYIPQNIPLLTTPRKEVPWTDVINICL